MSLSNMTVVQLKQILRDRGFSVAGKKADLIKRIEFIKTIKNKKTIHLKFRAECVADTVNFVKKCEKANIVLKKYICQVMENITFDDCEANFVVSTEHLTTILKIIKRIPDGHIMLETINFEKDYTGDCDNILAGYF